MAGLLGCRWFESSNLAYGKFVQQWIEALLVLFLQLKKTWWFCYMDMWKNPRSPHLLIFRWQETDVPSCEVAMIDEKLLGGGFDDFLRKEGIADEAEAVATKRVIAFQISEEMKRSNITKTELAHRMNTSRPVVDRLLDPSNQSVTLSTLGRAASAVGRSLKVELS
jgi:antitoxin HicB